MKKGVKCLVLCAALIGSISHKLHSGVINEYLAHVADEVDQASDSQKRKIILRTLDREYLQAAKDLKDIDKTKLYIDWREKKPEGGYYDFMSTEVTNPVALAISMGEVDLVRKFLQHIDPNCPESFVWGWRGVFSLAHIALDPKYPSPKKDVSLESRLKIIDLLGERGADFNITISGSRVIGGFSGGDYMNPPLVAGDNSGYSESYKLAPFVRARAFLYGADPDKSGTSHAPIKLDREPALRKLTLGYLIERFKNKAKLKLAPEVKTHMKKEAEGYKLAEIKRSQLFLEKLHSQIEREKQKSTKKARAKVRHLMLIEEERQKELKKDESFKARLVDFLS